MKTLLVQNPTAQAELGSSLIERGHKLTLAHDATDAYERCSRETFELIILDLADSPVLELCRWIRQREVTRTAFIITILQSETFADCQAALQAGADDVWLSPGDAQSIRAALLLAETRIREHQKVRHLEETLRLRAQQQVAIAALGESALSGNDLSTIAELVSSFVMQILNVPICCVLEGGEEGEKLRFLAGFGWPASQETQLIAPDPKSVIGYTLARGEPIVLTDLKADPRFSGPDLLRDQGIQSGLSVPIKGKTGSFGLLGAFTSEPRRFDEEDLRFLEGLANVLGAAVQRRRADLEQQRLRDQVQHLQRLESIGQLAAGLAHDYNNVLTIIHGHVTLVLGESELPAGSANSLKTALDAVERAAGLTRQLLTFSRKQSMRLEPIDLNAVIGNVTKLLDRILGQNVQLSFARGKDLPGIEADTGMLEQVIINLAVNARDAMPRGGQLTVSTSIEKVDAARAAQRPDARVGEFVLLRVRDTGCGMDAATLNRIFEPFFTTKEPGKGTGLGLATVYGIVKQHRGWIEVDSHPGRGTTFTIYLPSLGRKIQPAPAQPSEKPAAARNETVLLVEDEPTLRDLAQMLLQELGYQVISASSGLEAQRAWAKDKERIDVLLTDLVMPDGVTGFELAQKLQRERPSLKVLLTSGYDPEKVMQDMPGSRGFAFIQKPYRAEALARALRQCLGSSGQDR